MIDEKIKAENEQKKEYLKNYRFHVRRINRIEAELEEIRIMKEYPSVNNDGMPHGSGQGDLSGYAAQLDKMERDLRNERYQRTVTYKNIADQIKHLKSENEKDVMFYRYIKGMDWWEIAEKMGYCERQIHRFHGAGLAHICLKDVSECQ